MKNAKRKHKFVFDRGHALHAHRPAAAGDGSVARAVAGVTASRSQTSAGISPLLLDAVKLCNTCDNNSVWFYAQYSISQGIIPVPRRQGFSPSALASAHPPGTALLHCCQLLCPVTSDFQNIFSTIVIETSTFCNSDSETDWHRDGTINKVSRDTTGNFVTATLLIIT